MPKVLHKIADACPMHKLLTGEVRIQSRCDGGPHCRASPSPS